MSKIIVHVSGGSRQVRYLSRHVLLTVRRNWCYEVIDRLNHPTSVLPSQEVYCYSKQLMTYKTFVRRFIQATSALKVFHLVIAISKVSTVLLLQNHWPAKKIFPRINFHTSVSFSPAEYKFESIFFPSRPDFPKNYDKGLKINKLGCL